jgi:PadR family transcriptional regulator PadR
MSNRPYLGNFELMVLLAVIRLEDAAYGVTISRALETGTGREVGIGSVYAALDRLQEKRLVTSRLGEPTPERGGRAKRFFRVTEVGVREARTTREVLTTLWQGLPQVEGGHPWVRRDWRGGCSTSWHVQRTTGRRSLRRMARPSIARLVLEADDESNSR